MSRVVVAGGAGFIGAALCRRLVERGDQVACVDNLVTGRESNLEGLAGHPGFDLVRADICSGVDVAGPVDSVINLACPASPADFGPLGLEILEVGSTGTRVLLELAEAKGARLLHASTSEVYGDPLVHPQPETYLGNVNPIGPRSVYDESKRFAETLVMAHHRRRGTDVRIARIFNTYGPRMRADDGRVVSNLVTQALAGAPLTLYGDGRQTRSLCYVEDLVTGIVGILECDHVGPVNLGTTDERSVVELAQLVKELTGSASPVVHLPALADDPAQRRPDLSLAEALIGWSPATGLREGLARTIEWFAGAGMPGPKMSRGGQAGAG
ncbi:MAG: NAD-dependent epimerase/dehydratase family protein [Acidimicrobiales bacterium]